MLANSRVAVLDLTHGGMVLARKLKNIAAHVTGIDVYKTLSPGELEGLEKEGINTSQTPVNLDGFDVLVAPVHLDPGYPMLMDAVNNHIPVISHHSAVGEILSHRNLEDKVIIEITGTKAKTSTSLLLAEVLSRDRKVVSHTSRGVEDWSAKRTINTGLSITPASILIAMDIIDEAGLDPDVLIFEISLGGTGCADIGVITTISGDYMIANNTKPASDAKRQMILNARPGSSLAINYDALRFFGACRRDVNIISFSDVVNAACNVYYEDISSKGVKIASYMNKRQAKISIQENPNYDINSYRTAFVCVTAIAMAMDVDAETIERSLREFGGAEGRMKKTTFCGRTLIDNSNSGMNIQVAESALQYSKPLGGRIVIILGEEAKEVCEGLDPSGVRTFIEKHLGELDALVLVGERMRPLVKDNIAKICYANDLSAGMELAKMVTREKDIILSCVKCFR
jgi:UDP-N-acetylmuramyl pentapeptide synthase